DSAERRIEHIESEAESLDYGRRAKTLDEEIDQLERDERVEAELETLKSSRGSSSDSSSAKKSARTKDKESA
ncbi:MAG: phage shock protein PspA, partial [Pseudomonadota bacterium]